MMKVISISIFALITALGFSPKANGQEVFPAGTAVKSAAMDSAQTTSGAFSTFYNPAGLASDATTARADLEAGVAQAQYAYEHKDFDQVYVGVSSPFAAAGVVAPVFGPKWQLGLALFPTKRGELSINGMPRRVGSDTMALKVETQELALKSGLGISYVPMSGVAIGAGLIHSMEEKNISAAVIGASSPLVEQRLKNNFFKPILGARLTAKGSTLNVAGSPAVTKSYEGSQRKAGDVAPSAPNTINFEPAVVALGVGQILGPAALDLTANWRGFSAGRGVAKEGLASSTSSAQLSDVIEYGAKLSWNFTPAYQMSVAAAVLPTPWGEGSSADAETGKSEMGVAFGSANAVARRSFAVAGSYRLADATALEVTGLKTTGAREVSDQGASPGFYQQDLAVVSMGGIVQF